MNKQDYLAAAAQWKASYASLITDIRQARNEYKESQRAFAKCGSYNYNAGSQDEKNKAYNDAERHMQNRMSHRFILRQKATEMIEERHEMKREAGRAMAR